MSDKWLAAFRNFLVIVLCVFVLWVLVAFVNIHSRYSNNLSHNVVNSYIVSSAGVVLHGGVGADKSWIENSNDYPVIIKHINQSRGDRILDIFVLRPHTSKDIKVCFDDGFIITQVVVGSIMEVGFISANPPK